MGEYVNEFSHQEHLKLESSYEFIERIKELIDTLIKERNVV